MRRFIGCVLLIIVMTFTAAAETPLTLSADLREIQESAFENDGALDVVIVPEGCVSIGRRAFYNTSVTDVYLPFTITSIHPTAFDACDDIVIHADAGSYVQSWCQDNDIPFIVNGAQDRASNQVQDPRFFMPGFTYGDEEYLEKYHKTWIRVSGKTSDLPIFYAYIDRLCDGGHNFTLTHTFSFSSFQSWSLHYTGTAKVGEPLEEQFDSNYSGEMTLYTMTSNNAGTEFYGYIAITEGLEFADLGLRADGGDVTIERPGVSSNAALIQSGDAYATDDGRFSVTAGKAQIVLDGVRCETKEITHTRLKDGGQDQFLIEDYKNHESVGLSLPMAKLNDGAEFTAKQLGMPQSANITTKSTSDFFNYFWQYALGVCHSGDYYLLRYPASNALRDALVQVMKWDEQEDIGVVYMALAFDTAPYEVECMFALRPSLASDGDDSKEYSTLSVDGSKTLTGPAGDYEEFNKTWDWEIVSGDGVVSLSALTGRSVTVKGVKRGEAVVRVTYDCSYYYSDVLTGIQRTGRKATTQDYVITVE